MRYRRSRGFTVVELLVVAIAIAILASIVTVGYNGVIQMARTAAVQSDLRNVAAVMQIAYQQSGTYPNAIPPETLQPSGSVTLDVKWAGKFTRYTSLTPVQNGVLLSQICQELINDGLGQGVNQGGQIQNYITGCGNWNNGSMQVTAWDSRVWNTPVTSGQLLNYANTFTTGDTWNSAQIGVVNTFYTQLVQRHIGMGGTFPITSFWDSWANGWNGGIMHQALPANPVTRESYCVEATVQGMAGKVWHVNEDGVVREGPCQQ